MKFFSLVRYLSISLCCAAVMNIQASEATRREYLQFIRENPYLVANRGDAAKGEIEIITDPKKMADIEKSTGRDVGLVAKDKFWIWINDACRFPSGAEGVYGRILMTKSLNQAAGIAVMPILPDGRIVLNCNYRHATRSWEIELPRGGVDKGESAESAARRETLEETGMVIDQLIALGSVPPDSGLSSVVAPVFAAHVVSVGMSHQEAEEAIEAIFALTADEIKQGFKNGYWVCKIRDKKVKANFRDPFLAYAFLLYQLRT